MAQIPASAAAPPRPHRPFRVPAVVLGALAVGLAFGSTGCGQPAPPSPRQPDAATVAAAITEDVLRADLQVLGGLTTSSEGHRSVGSDAYDAAAAMIEGELEAAGWTLASDAYDDVAFVDEGGSFLEVGGRTFAAADLKALVFAPAGEVEGPVIALDWQLDAPVDSAKGCAVTHYSILPANSIVVVSQGPCLRREQALAAQQAGAAAFVAVYPGIPSGLVYRPTLIEPTAVEIPAAGVSRAAAAALLEAASTRETAHLVTRVRTRQVPTRSVIAELPGSEPGPVIMLGAHLDSALEGPGINDDGSGVAALLAIARALSGTRPRATIRLAFWSGEELGLHGSYRYATALSTEDARAILVYANVDMIASPNGFAGVYDEPGAPVGSAAARDLLTSAVERAGGTPIGVDISGGSDHYGFTESGVATAGVFSGAGEPVTAEQSKGSGAVAGRPADACYHQLCDDLENANLRLARVLAAGLADFTVRVANNPELLRH